MNASSSLLGDRGNSAEAVAKKKTHIQNKNMLSNMKFTH